ncbi:MAG: hypothetical protein Q8936_14090 [Bacillota bacterium]|nr:hypothetical protein [Bacillota bacterium]
MSVFSFNILFPGQNNGVVPRIGHLFSKTDTLATISAAGYLDTYIKSQGFVITANDAVIARGTDGTQWYKPVFTNGSCQLTVLP